MNGPIKDGGPAFPLPAHVGANGEQPYPIYGMSLRDWFAGQALASMTVAPDYSKGPCNNAMAERAYVIADAMLVARDEGLCKAYAEVARLSSDNRNLVKHAVSD